MEFTAEAVANIIGGTVEGRPETVVNKLAKIETGEPGALSFLANPKYLPYIYTTGSSVVIVSNDFVPKQELNLTLIRVEDPYSAFAQLLEMYNKLNEPKSFISDQACISKSASLGKDVMVGEFSYIADHAVIGDGVKIYPQVYIGANVVIREGTVLYPGVKIYHNCEIGSNCTIHGGVVIGADGFGFAPQTDNNYMKVAQIGNVIIEDNVEIGANTTIDRATLGSTIIRRGVKLDNLIQVAHNVEIGENTVIAAQTGIAGSAKLGRNMMIGGQVAIAGHIEIADDVKIGAKAGVAHRIVTPGVTLLGAPSIEISRFRRVIAIFNNLDKLAERVGILEKEARQRNRESNT